MKRNNSKDLLLADLKMKQMRHAAIRYTTIHTLINLAFVLEGCYDEEEILKVFEKLQGIYEDISDDRLDIDTTGNFGYICREIPRVAQVIRNSAEAMGADMTSFEKGGKQNA